MNDIGPEAVLNTFIIFCRVGGCLMFMPGFSSARVPMQVRALLAAAATLALAPMLLPAISGLGEFTPVAAVSLLLTEASKGALIGLMARYFFLALEFAATLAASAAGITGMPGVPLEDTEPLPSFASLLTAAAMAMFFISDMHWEVLRALTESYRALPVGEGLSPQFALTNVTTVLSKSFVLALQICSPFVIYSIAINMLFGIANKLTPQVPVYFVSLPFVIFGGLLVLYFVVADFLRIFIRGFENWLVTG